MNHPMVSDYMIKARIDNPLLAKCSQVYDFQELRSVSPCSVIIVKRISFETPPLPRKKGKKPSTKPQNFGIFFNENFSAFSSFATCLLNNIWFKQFFSSYNFFCYLPEPIIIGHPCNNICTNNGNFISFFIESTCINFIL